MNTWTRTRTARIRRTATGLAASVLMTFAMVVLIADYALPPAGDATVLVAKAPAAAAPVAR